MPKKKEAINPIVGTRLKTLLASYGMTQKQLAEKLNYTDQHISQIVRGNRRLTVEVAKDIVKLFPDHIRYEWLMGYDDDSSQFEHGARLIDEHFAKQKTMEDFIRMIAKSKKYEHSDLDYSIKQRKQIVCHFTSKESSQRFDCPWTEYAAFCNEIWHYARYLFDEIIAKQKNLQEEMEVNNNG